MKTQIRYLLQALILCWLLCDFLSTVSAQSPTCANNDQLVLNTSTKTYQCITPGALPAGSGTTMIVANAGVTGTTVNRLAKLTGAPSTAVITATTDTENAIGIVTSGAGTTGNATITILGQASCEFDGATTAGNYFTISSTTAGKCHDAGSTYPTSGATYGRVLSTNGAGGTFVVELMTPDIAFQNAGNGKSKPGTPANSYQFNSSNQFTGGILSQPDSSTVLLDSGSRTTGKLRFSPSSNPSNPFIIQNNDDLELQNGFGIVPKFQIRQVWSDNGGSQSYQADQTGFAAGFNSKIGFNSGHGATINTFFRVVNGNNPGQVLLGSVDGSGTGGTIAFGAESPAQITSNQNDYTLSGMAYFLRVTTDATRNITGFRDPNAPLNGRQQEGEIKQFWNTGSNLAIFTNQDTNSTAANRIISASGGNIYVASNQFMNCTYDNTTQRWRCYNPAPLTNTATLDFGNLATIGCEDLTITVTGAASGDVVNLGVPNGSIVANSSYSAWVSAADTVTVRFCALVSGDPASGTFRVDVWKH